jgi:RHS repeat-associated protein
MLAGVPSVTAATLPAAVQLAPVTSKPDLFSAMVAARAQGAKVLVASEESSTSLTWANPDGSLTTEMDAAPARERQSDGAWVDVDTTLTSVNGLLVPKVSVVPMEFSAGGSSLIASEQTASGVAQLSWDTSLPAPTVSGNTATYPNVRPGVDLILQASRLGLEASFVLHNAPTAALSLPLTVTTRGFTASAAADGSLQFKDAKGALVGVGGAPVMFGAGLDKTTQQPTQSKIVAGALSAATSAPVSPVPGVTLPGSGSGTARTWTLQPDAGFLADPAVSYPVTIDPSLNFNASSSTYVQSGSSTSQYTNTELKIGTPDSGTTVYRSYLGFSMPSALNGMYITSAYLKLYNDTSTVCSSSNDTVNVYSIGSAFNSSTVWSNKPSQGTSYGSANYAHGFTGCSAAYDNVYITGLIQDWASNSSHLQQLQVSASETNSDGFKQFHSVNHAYFPPNIQVSYRAYPDIPGTPVLSPASGSGPSSYWTNTATPTLSASVNSATGSVVYGLFKIYNGATLVWSGNGSNANSGSGISTVSVPSGAGLTAGVSYTAKVYGESGGAESSTPSTTIGFQVDTTAPGAPTITADHATNGSWVTSAPGSNTFTFTKATGNTDTTDFLYSEDNSSWQTVAATSGSATVAWNPTSGGHTVQVEAKDAAANTSSITTFSFGAGAPAFTNLPPQTAAATSTTLPATASGPPSATSAYLQWRATGTTTWATVSSTYVKSGGSSWTGTVSASGAGSATPTLAWDAAGTATAAGLTAPASLDLQACFKYSGASDQCSATTTVQWIQDALGGDFGATTVGPATVSLSTGELAVNSQDALVPGGAGGMGVSRTYLTTQAGSAAGTGFGPGWSSTLPAPDQGAMQDTVSDQVTVASTKTGDIDLVDPSGTSQTFVDPNWTGGGDSNLGVNPVTLKYANQSGADTTGDFLILSANELKLTLTTSDGTQTIWTRTGTTSPWSPYQVVEPQQAVQSGTQAGGTTSTLSGTYSGSGLPQGVVSGDTYTQILQLNSGVTDSGHPSYTTPAQICSPTPIAGCQVLTVVYAGPSTTKPTGSNTGPYPGQVREILSTAWNPDLGTPAIETDVAATYAYSSTGLLKSWYDPRADVTSGSHLTTAYAYDSNKRLSTLTPPGLRQWVYNYDASNRVSSIQRWDPVLSANDTTTFSYGVALSGSGLPDLTTGSGGIGTWGQPTSDAPSLATAVFRPDHVPSGTPTSTDWPYAEISYMDLTGRTTNTADYGAGQWLVDANIFDSSGRSAWTLTAGNRALALASTCSAAESPLVCAQPTSAIRAQLLSSITVYGDQNPDPNDGADPAIATDSYGPAVPVQLNSGGLVTARTHVHVTYDASAPTPVGVDKWRLPTTLSTSVYKLDGLADPTQIGASGADTDTRTKANGYDPIDGASNTGPTSGWILGRAATSTTDPGTGHLNIVGRTLYDSTGHVLQQRQPSSSGTDAATTVDVYYSAGANTPSACGNKPAWAGLPCQHGPAAQPSGTTIPTTQVAAYTMLLSPETQVETSGTSTRTTSTTFDAVGRPRTAAISDTLSSDTSVPSLTYGYDSGSGLETSVATTAGTASTQYDDSGRVTSQTDGSGGNTTTTTYDSDSRPATITDAKGSYSLTYDGSTEHRSLVAALNVGIGNSIPSTFAVSYDPAGKETSVVLPNGVTEAQVFDADGGMQSRSFADSTGTAIASWTLERNAFGEVVGLSGPSSQGSRLGAYTYDAAARLVNVADSLGSVCTQRKYTLDTDSNRSSMDSYVGSFGAGCPAETSSTSTWAGTYDSYDRLTATTVTGGGAGSGSYGYDVLGRTTTLPGIDAAGWGSGNETLTFYANDVVHSEAQGSMTATAGLDPLMRLAAWTSGGVTTVNHYDDGSDTPQWVDNGNGTWNRNVANPDGQLGLIVSGTSAGGAQSAAVELLDPSGSVAASIPDTANVAATSVGAFDDADEFGRTSSTGSPSLGWEGGNGRPTNTTTGLVQMGARQYNPATGHFLSADPVRGGNANPYTYSIDPINTSDLNGLTTGPPGGSSTSCTGTPAYYIAADYWVWSPWQRKYSSDGFYVWFVDHIPGVSIDSWYVQFHWHYVERGQCVQHTWVYKVYNIIASNSPACHDRIYYHYLWLHTEYNWTSWYNYGLSCA